MGAERIVGRLEILAGLLLLAMLVMAVAGWFVTGMIVFLAWCGLYALALWLRHRAKTTTRGDINE